MTEATQLQVRDLLPSGLQLEKTMKDALSQQDGIGTQKLAWNAIGSQASDAISGALKIDALQVLGGAWCAAKLLHDYTDRSKHPQDERSVVYLGSHRFKKTIYPELTVTIEPFNPVRLRFTLDLIADIRSIVLAICNGYITSTGGGDGALSAQLKYGDLALNNMQARKVQFPGSYEFKAPGLAIA